MRAGHPTPGLSLYSHILSNLRIKSCDVYKDLIVTIFGPAESSAAYKLSVPRANDISKDNKQKSQVLLGVSSAELSDMKL